MKILNDSEHRIFLAAMWREKKVCIELDTSDQQNKLLSICRSIEKKVNDAVPVVRCKDCKHHTDEHKDTVYCPSVIGDWVDGDWYCGDGERKDGDE